MISSILIGLAIPACLFFLVWGLGRMTGYIR